MGRLRSRDRFKRIAIGLIEKYGTNDPFELCNLLNIKIIYEDNFKSFFGMYCEVNKEKCIIINSKHDELTKRIICSHELASLCTPLKRTMCRLVVCSRSEKTKATAILHTNMELWEHLSTAS